MGSWPNSNLYNSAAKRHNFKFCENIFSRFINITHSTENWIIAEGTKSENWILETSCCFKFRGNLHNFVYKGLYENYKFRLLPL